MFLPKEEVSKCIAEALNMAHVYKLNAHCDRASAKSLDEVVRLFREYLNKDVEIWTFNVASASAGVRAVYMEVGGKYEIYFLESLERGDQRFALCKELFHVLLDEEGCRNNSVHEHLEEFMASWSQMDSSPDSPVVWEILAEIAAAEFLFPFDDRVAILANGQCEVADVARRYEIPVAIVERYLSSSTMAFISAHRPQAKLHAA